MESLNFCVRLSFPQTDGKEAPPTPQPKPDVWKMFYDWLQVRTEKGDVLELKTLTPEIVTLCCTH